MNDLYYLGGESMESLFERIDSMGGWPLKWKYVTYQHCCGVRRPCYFGNVRLRDEWNTTLFTLDDYLWWKLSAARKLEIKQEHFKEFKIRVANICITCTN